LSHRRLPGRAAVTGRGLLVGERPIDRVLDRLEGVRARNGHFVAFCPSHDDRREQSLSIKEGDDGRALLNCFGGCSFGAVVKALGLEQRDLFANRNGGEGGLVPPENVNT
jgi:hypothetical protein